MSSEIHMSVIYNFKECYIVEGVSHVWRLQKKLGKDAVLFTDWPGNAPLLTVPVAALVSSPPGDSGCGEGLLLKCAWPGAVHQETCHSSV